MAALPVAGSVALNTQFFKFTVYHSEPFSLYTKTDLPAELNMQFVNVAVLAPYVHTL